MCRNRHAQKGSLILVVLCLLAVLGIALASFLAVGNQSMKLSNRSYRTSMSAQLAEMGLEEALRAFNQNDWSNWSTNPTNVSSGAWTLDTTNRRATRTIQFLNGKLGQGVTGTVKIRVDNYNSAQLDATWTSTSTYRINDLVGYNGIWYRSVRNNNTNQTPSATNLTWWVTNPMPWTWSSDRTYSQYEMVNYKGIWYRCISTPPVSAGTTTYAPQVPTPATTYWAPIPSMRAWGATTAYALNDVVAYTDLTTSDITLYRCTIAHTSSASFSSDTANWSNNVQTVSLAWTSGTVYTRGSMVYYVGSGVTQYRWYYCIQSGTSNTSPSTDTAMWAPVWPDTSAPTSPLGGTYYNVGSYINYLDNCYRCTTAHTYFNWGTSSSNWTSIASDTVGVGTAYYIGDYINYGGTWYRCTIAHTYVSWASDSGKWTSINASPYLQLFYFGSSSLSTTSNSIFYYAGSNWYRYMGGYVLALTGNMHLWTSGYKYNLGDAVYYSPQAKWYRCILAHTGSGTILPTNTTYWATAPNFSTDWNSGRQYSQYDTVRYNGVWYLSLLSSNTNQNPSTANSYWIGANTSDTNYTWNALTSYAVGNYRCYGGVWYKCLSGGSNKSPNNSNNWTSSWANSWGITTGAPVIYAEGTVTLPDSTTAIKTQMRATIAPASLFPNAIAATTTISANSGGTVDSYDYSLGTTYASQVNTSTNYSAVVAAGDKSGTAVTLASTAVKGYVAAPSSSSAPYGPLISSGGTVKGFSSPGSPNIDLTRLSRSPYIPQFDTLPSGSGSVAANWATLHKGTPLTLSTTTNLGTPGDTTPSRYYYNGNLTIGTGTIQYLNINGPVILYINGDLFITNSGSTGRINVSSAGSAEIHVTGAFKADAGGAGILSYTYNPKTFVVICDTASTADHYYSEGANPLYGVVYAPYTTSTNGYYNNNTSTNIYGAVSAKKVTYSGANLNIHYDTALRYATIPGVDQPWAISEWRELTDPNERAILP